MRHDIFWTNFKLSCDWSCGHVTFLVVMWPFMWACDHINIENNYLVSSSWLFWYAIWHIFDQFQFIMWPVMWSCDWSCSHIPCHVYLWQYKHLNCLIWKNELVLSNWSFWYATRHILKQFQIIMWLVMWSCDIFGSHVTIHVGMWSY